MMHPARVLYVPYRVARLPLAAVDRRLARYLGRDSAVRLVSRGTLRTVDRVAAVMLDEPPLRTD